MVEIVWAEIIKINDLTSSYPTAMINIKLNTSNKVLTSTNKNEANVVHMEYIGELSKDDLSEL